MSRWLPSSFPQVARASLPEPRVIYSQYTHTFTSLKLHRSFQCLQHSRSASTGPRYSAIKKSRGDHFALASNPPNLQLANGARRRYNFDTEQSASLDSLMILWWKKRWWYPSDIVALLQNHANWLLDPGMIPPLRVGRAAWVGATIKSEQVTYNVYTRLGEHTDEDYAGLLTHTGYCYISIGHLSVDAIRYGVFYLSVATEFGNLEAATWLLKIDADPVIHARFHSNLQDPHFYMSLGLRSARLLLAKWVTRPECPWQSVVTYWEDQLKPVNQAKFFRDPMRVAEAIYSLTRAAAWIEPGPQFDLTNEWSRFANPLKLLAYILEELDIKKINVLPGEERTIKEKIKSTLLDLVEYKDPDAAFELALSEDFGTDSWRTLLEIAVSPSSVEAPADAYWLFTLYLWQHAGSFNFDSPLPTGGHSDDAAFDLAVKALNATHNEPGTLRDRLLASAAMARLVGKYDLGLNILRDTVERAPSLMGGLRQSDRESRVSELRDFLDDYQSSAWNDSLYRERIGTGDELIAQATVKARMSLEDRKRRLHGFRK